MEPAATLKHTLIGDCAINDSTVSDSQPLHLSSLNIMTKLIPRPLFRSNPKLQSLLTNLHSISLAQETEGYGGPLNSKGPKGGVVYPEKNADATELAQFREKLVALDEDKASFVNMTLKAMKAQRVFEAGTSFGVSTLYLVEAVRHNRSTFGKLPSGLPSRVWGTEVEPSKAKIATSNVMKAFSSSRNSDDFHLLEGDVLKTIPEIRHQIQDESIDGLLLDIWAPLALPILKLMEQKLRKGGVVFVDNAIAGEERYRDLSEYLDKDGNGWHSIILPFRDGFKMSVKTGI